MNLQNSYTALWRYMYNMYQLDAFTQSCPADQDIINHYKLQQVINIFDPNINNILNAHIFSLQMLKMKKHEELETPTFTTSIPIDINDSN